MRLELYTKQYGVVHPQFNMPRFYYNDQTWTIDSFKVKLNIDFVYFYDVNYFCINVYNSIEDLKITLKMAMKM